MERRLRGGGGLDLRLEWSLDPSGTLDLREGLVWELGMNLRLDLRGRLQRCPLLELHSDLLRVDLALCLGLERLELLNLAEVLHLNLGADLGRDLDVVRLPRARHDRGHRETFEDLRAGRRLHHRDLRRLDVGELGDGELGLDLRGRRLGHGGRDLRLDLRDRELRGGDQLGLKRGDGKLRGLHLRGRHLGYV